MIPVLVSEFMDWKVYGSRRTIMFLLISLGLTSVFTRVRPDWLGVAFTANLAWIGLLAGRQEWNAVRMEKWMIDSNLKSWEVIAGKIGGVLVINLFHLFLALPVFIIMKVLWGVPIGVIGMFLLLCFCTILIATLIPVLTIHLSDGFELLALLLAAIIFVITFAVKEMYFLNPLIQVYHLMHGDKLTGCSWFAGSLFLGVCLFPITAFLLKRMVNPN